MPKLSVSQGGDHEAAELPSPLHLHGLTRTVVFCSACVASAGLGLGGWGVASALLHTVTLGLWLPVEALLCELPLTSSHTGHLY